MAKKNQKFKKYTTEFKQKVVNKYKEGFGGAKSLAKKYNVPYHTIENWLKKDKEGKGLEKQKTGRPKKEVISLEDYKERYEILKKYQAFLEVRHGKK